MRKTFPEFARKTQEEYKKDWDNALIVFDTNVLLSLYYYSPETQKTIIDTMKNLKDYLWMPYQVGKEFYIGRIDVINKLETLPSKIIKAYENVIDLAPRNSGFYKILSSKTEKLREEVKEEAKKSQQTVGKDKIADILESIYKGRVGKPMSQEKCKQIEKEYQKNIKNKICCPGYKDANKQDNASGDYYVWKQILEHAIEIKKNIIFVTEDAKEDWWWKSSDKLICARHELKKEFYEQTGGCSFHMYNLQRFLNVSAQYSGVKVDEKVEEEIKNSSSDNTDIEEMFIKHLLAKKDSDVTKFRDNLAIYNKMFKPLKNIERLEKSFQPVRNFSKQFDTLNKIHRKFVELPDLEAMKKKRSELLAEILAKDIENITDCIDIKEECE